ncbi:MAG: hypothetical protein M3300_13100 [Actinomycetota bacterium]|nr:hypothetical protein [Actinomycetota bacterium]
MNWVTQHGELFILTSIPSGDRHNQCLLLRYWYIGEGRWRLCRALRLTAAAAALDGTPTEVAILSGAAATLRATFGIALPPSERDRYERRVAAAPAQIDLAAGDFA